MEDENTSSPEFVTREVAQKEIEKWLDFKRVRPSRRELLADNIDIMIDAVADGVLIVHDDCTLTQKLDIPIARENKEDISELNYVARKSVKAINSDLKGIKAGDSDGRVLAYVSSLTNQARAVIGFMDTGDYNLAGAISVFFM